MPDESGSDTSPDKPTGSAADRPHAPTDTVVQHGFPLLARDPGTPAPPGYELLAEVGRGGMGVVYRARDLALGRDVAVKVLQDRYTTDGPVARQFVEEAQITSQLQHPGVPPIHQVGALADGRPFLVMKLIKGDTLETLLRAQGTGPAELLAIFEKLCETVGYAHERGVIHRDLKPSNVMVGSFGEVQVMDWGLAKVLRNGGAGSEGASGSDSTAPLSDHSELRIPQADVTLDGSVMGTLGYMAPEQAGGELAKIDRRADVFALGGVLCAVLTGRPPYTGTDASEIHLKAVRAQTADCFAALDASGAGPELVSLCKWCLSAEPEARPKDASAVAQAVADFRRATEERARQVELARVRAEAERDAIQRSQSGGAVLQAPPAAHPTRRAVLVGAPVAVAAVVGAYFAFRKRPGPPPDRGPSGSPPLPPPQPVPPAVLVAQREVGGPVAGLAVSDDGRWLAVALDSVDAQNGGVKLFDRAYPGAPRWVKWPDVPCRSVSFAPDGTLLAVAAGNGLRVVNLGDESDVAFPDATAPGVARGVCFSPDGKVLALACEQDDAPDRTPRPGLVRLWNSAARAKPNDLTNTNLPIRCVAFSFDSALLAAGLGPRPNSPASAVEVWKVAGGHEKALDPRLAGVGPIVTFARSAPRCAVSDKEGVKLYHTPSFAPEREFGTNGAGEPTAIALRPDGALLALALAKTIWVYEVSTGLEVAALDQHEGDVSALVFALDGKTLISGGQDRTVREWTVPASK
jgi:serine/threonine protein kinase